MNFRFAAPWLIVVVAFLVGCSGTARPVPNDAPPQQPLTLTGRSAPTLRVTFVNVGQADAILLQLGDVDVLVDAGQTYSKGLQKALTSVTPPLEMLAITHPHIDHYGGADEVLEQERVLRVITNGERRGPPRDPKGNGVTWFRLEDDVHDEGLKPEHLSVGDVLSFRGGLKLRVLATGDPGGGKFPDTPQGSDINNDSLVLMVEYAGRRFLLTGDIETGADQMLVKKYCGGKPANCPALKADVMKVPHHGSSHFDPQFFAAVSPKWAVISADYDNPKGHHCLPRRTTLAALVGLGVGVLSTNSGGGTDVVVEVGPDGKIRTKPSASASDVFVWSHDANGECVADTCRLVDGAKVDCERQPVAESAR